MNNRTTIPAKVPPKLFGMATLSARTEMRAYKFPEFARGRERLSRTRDGLCADTDPDTGWLTLQGINRAPGGQEDSKFVSGTMYLTRLPRELAMPTWAVDISIAEDAIFAMGMGLRRNARRVGALRRNVNRARSSDLQQHGAPSERAPGVGQHVRPSCSAQALTPARGQLTSIAPRTGSV